MSIGKKCYCLFAVISIIAVILLIAAFHDYAIADWTVISWVGGFFIVIAVFLCARCRLKEDADDDT
jgi:hypothetical protein